MDLPIDADSTAGTIDLAKAVNNAMDFVRKLAEQELIRGPLNGLVMEEVVRTDDGHWDITLGWRGADPVVGPKVESPWRTALTGEPRRPPSQYFKVITISRYDGTVLAAKIRGSV